MPFYRGFESILFFCWSLNKSNAMEYDALHAMYTDFKFIKVRNVSYACKQTSKKKG